MALAAGPTIVKADGTVEEFDPAKLESSLRRAGAGDHTAKRIRSTIEATIVRGASTKEIYTRAFAMLRHEARPVAARYSLRRALFEFGPSGHPFEDFVSELFKSEGWKVEPRKMIRGKCTMHEVDILATRDGENLAAELKYHNDPNYKTDVKVALYVKARFDDIWQCDPGSATCPVDRGFLITNTKFTSQAVEYAKCSGIGLIGWSYPLEGNLYDRILAAGIYPITALTSLRKAEKRMLIDNRIVTCAKVLEERGALRELGLSPERIATVLTESQTLCAPQG